MFQKTFFVFCALVSLQSFCAIEDVAKGWTKGDSEAANRAELRKQLPAPLLNLKRVRTTPKLPNTLRINLENTNGGVKSPTVIEGTPVVSAGNGWKYIALEGNDNALESRQQLTEILISRLCNEPPTVTKIELNGADILNSDGLNHTVVTIDISKHPGFKDELPYLIEFEYYTDDVTTGGMALCPVRTSK